MMMNSKLFPLFFVIAVLLPPAAHADEGHDHGPAPQAAVPALPRFAATTELFELVGVLDGRRLTLYLDHADDNRPVQGARLELEFGGQPLPVQARAEGEFEATLAQDAPPGEIAITATVTTAQASDLIAAELDLHEAAHHHDEPRGGGGRLTAAIAAAAALVLVAAATIAWRARRPRHVEAA